MARTWVFNAAGESQMIDLPEGAKAPEGWGFSPAEFGVELKREPPVLDALAQYAQTGASEAAPAAQEDPRIPALWDRVGILEQRLAALSDMLKGMQPAPPVAEVPPAPEAEPGDGDTVESVLAAMGRPELEAEAAKLSLKVDGRWNDDRLRREVLAKIAEVVGE